MILRTEADVLTLIEAESFHRGVLELVHKQNLKDWWIGAGFVRNLVWDELHSFTERTPLNDIDLIYYDPKAPKVEDEKRIWQSLKAARPEIIWSVTNAAHRHAKTGHNPYKSSTDCLAHWVETATCVGVNLDNYNQLRLTAPHGVEDLLDLKIRISPLFQDGQAVFEARQQKKGWPAIWPKLTYA